MTSKHRGDSNLEEQIPRNVFYILPGWKDAPIESEFAWQTLKAQCDECGVIRYREPRSSDEAGIAVRLTWQQMMNLIGWEPRQRDGAWTGQVGPDWPRWICEKCADRRVVEACVQAVRVAGGGHGDTLAVLADLDRKHLIRQGEFSRMRPSTKRACLLCGIPALDLGASLVSHFPASDAVSYFMRIAAVQIAPCEASGLKPLLWMLKRRGRAALGVTHGQ